MFNKVLNTAVKYSEPNRLIRFAMNNNQLMMFRSMYNRSAYKKIKYLIVLKPKGFSKNLDVVY